MSDEFDPFNDAAPNAISDEPIALGDPSENVSPQVGKSSRPVESDSHDFDNEQQVNKSPSNNNSHIEDDPFANVDGGDSASNANKFDSFSNQVENKDEETPLSLWEKERAVVLRERAAKADKDKQQLLEQARSDLEKFYEDQKAKLAKTAKTNRADEKKF